MLNLIPQLAVLQEQAYDRGPLLIAASVASVFAGQNAGALSTAAKGPHLRIPGGKLTVSAFNALAAIALKSISTSFLLNEGTAPSPGPPILPSSTIPLEGLSPTTTFFDPRFQPLLHESVLFVAGITLATGAGVLLVLKRGVFIVEFGNGGTKKGGKRIRNGSRNTGKASGSGKAPDGEPGDGEADDGAVDKAADGNEAGDGGSAPPSPPPPGGSGNDIESDFPANAQGIPLWQILLMLAGLGFTTHEIVKITRSWVKKHKSGRLTLPRLPKFSVNFTLGINASDTLPFASRLDAASVLITSDIPKFLSPAPPAALRLAPLALPEAINSRPVRGLIEFVTSTLSNANTSPIYPNAAELSRICPASPNLMRLSPNFLPIQLAQRPLHVFGKSIVDISLSPSSLSTLPALPKSTLVQSLPTTLANTLLPTPTLSKLLPTTTTLASALSRSTNTVPEAYRRFTLASALPKPSYTTVPEAFRRFTLSAPRPKSIPTFSLKVPLSKSAITNSLPKPTTTTRTPTLIRATPTIKATFTAVFHKAQTTTISKGLPKATVIKQTFFRVVDTPIRYTTSSERPTKSFPLRLLRAFLDRYPCATVTGQVVRTLAAVAAACVVIVSCKLVIAFLQWMVRLERERDAARFEEVVEATQVDERGVAAAGDLEEGAVGEEGDSEVTLYVDKLMGVMEPDVVLPSHVSLDFEDARPAYGFTTSTPRISRVMHAREVEVREEVAVAHAEEESVVERQVDVSEDGDVVEEDLELVGTSVEVHVSEESTEVEERVEAEDDDDENGSGDGVDDVCASDEEEGDSQASEACSDDEDDVEDDDEDEDGDDDNNEEGSSGVVSGDAAEEGDGGADSFGLAEVEADNEAEMESFGLTEVAVDEDDHDNEEEEITPPDVATEEEDDNEEDNEEDMVSSDVATEEEGEDEDEDDAESSGIAIEDEKEDGGDVDNNISGEAEVYETVATASVSVEDANNDALDEAAGISLESEVAIDARNHNEPEHDAESSDTSNVLADLEKVEKKQTPKWKTLMDEINIAPPVRYPDLFDGETDTKKIVRGLLDGVHKKRAAPVKPHFDDNDEEEVEVISEGEEQKRLIERLDGLYEEAVETKASFSAEFEHDRPIIVQQWGSQHELFNRDRPRCEDRLSTAGAGRSRLGGDPQTV